MSAVGRSADNNQWSQRELPILDTFKNLPDNVRLPLGERTSSGDESEISLGSRRGPRLALCFFAHDCLALAIVCSSGDDKLTSDGRAVSTPKLLCVKVSPPCNVVVENISISHQLLSIKFFLFPSSFFVVPRIGMLHRTLKRSPE